MIADVLNLGGRSDSVVNSRILEARSALKKAVRRLDQAQKDAEFCRDVLVAYIAFEKERKAKGK